MSDPVTDPGAEFGAQLWESVVEALTTSNSLTLSYLAMARTCHAVDVEGTLVVVVNSKFVKQRLTDRAVSATIKTAVAEQIGYDMPIIYTVAPGAKDLEVIIKAAHAAVHGDSAASGARGKVPTTTLAPLLPPLSQPRRRRRSSKAISPPQPN